MPSSPEPRPATPWELQELRSPRIAAVPTSRTAFAATDPTPRPSAVFEVGTAAGVPDRLLTEARATAQAAGYLTGWANGVRAAEQRAAAEADRHRVATDEAAAEQRESCRRAVTALESAAAALEDRALPGAAELEELIVTAALAVAEELVGAMVRDDATRAPAALARVLSLAPADEDLVVRLAPVDHAALESDAAEILDGSGNRTITLVADPSLEPGDAVASSAATEVDARIRACVARVRTVLGQ